MKLDIHNNLIKFGSLHLKDMRVLDLDGEPDQVHEFLQGQVTSDINLLKNNCFQLSAICDHKGQVLCDFFIYMNKNVYKLIVNKCFEELLIKELSVFAKFNKVSFVKIKQDVYGLVSRKDHVLNAFLSNDYFELSISLEDNSKDEASVEANAWDISNKILGNLFLTINESKKFRPNEINYDYLRVSFDKGCYRGQEIVARMKYLGVDRRKFCILIIKNGFDVPETVKIVGETVKADDLIIFNAILKKEDIKNIRNLDPVLYLE